MVSATCPHCGEPVEIAIDPGEGDHSRTEDCTVCCAPMVVSVHLGLDGEIDVSLRREND